MADSARHYFSWEAENYFNCLRLFLKSIRWLAWGMAIKHLWKMFFNHLILFVRKWNTLEVNNSAPPGDDGINDLSFYQIWVFMTIFLSQIDLFTVHPSYKETMHCKFNNTTILGVQLSYCVYTQVRIQISFLHFTDYESDFSEWLSIEMQEGEWNISWGTITSDPS